MSEPAKQAPGRDNLLDRPLNRRREDVEFDPGSLGMAPISLEVLVVGQPCPADLFLPLYDRDQGQVSMTMACRLGEEFRELWRDRLLEAQQRAVFVSLDQLPLVSEYFQRHAAPLLDDPELPLPRKQLLVMELSALNLCEAFASDLSPRELRRAVKTTGWLLQRVTNDEGLLGNLSQLLRSDYCAYTHSVNVGLVAMAFGRYLNLTTSRVESLGMAGMLHDLGRAKLPEGLCGKPGPLSEAEWALVRSHPLRGYQMLTTIPSVSLEVLKMVLHHHENADGSGYPQGLTVERTPLGARILRVVDAYDAMTSPRPHRPAMSAREAAACILEQSPDQFGEDIGPRFVRFLASPFMGC